MTTQFRSLGVADTEAFGKKIGETLSGNEVIALYGGLGMGKTAFVRGVAAGLGIDGGEVSSPTFALVHQYGNGSRALYHFDMYRVETFDDLYSTGFFDYLDYGGILAIEWSENIEAVLPENKSCLRLPGTDGMSKRTCMP